MTTSSTRLADVRRETPATGEIREAFLLAANVASIIRDEYCARSQEEGLSPVQRERYTYASTIAKQVKGEILAYAGIQEWPAPKPLDAARAAHTATPERCPTCGSDKRGGAAIAFVFGGCPDVWHDGAATPPAEEGRDG